VRRTLYFCPSNHVGLCSNTTIDNDKLSPWDDTKSTDDLAKALVERECNERGQARKRPLKPIAYVGVVGERVAEVCHGDGDLVDGEEVFVFRLGQVGNRLTISSANPLNRRDCETKNRPLHVNDHLECALQFACFVEKSNVKSLDFDYK
jgi:hypothetical protein